MTTPAPDIELRECKVCGDPKPLSDFPIKGGYHRHTCKKCMQAYRASQDDSVPAAPVRNPPVVSDETVALLSDTWLHRSRPVELHAEGVSVRQHVCADDDGDEVSQARWAARRASQRARYEREREVICKRARDRYHAQKQSAAA